MNRNRIEVWQIRDLRGNISHYKISIIFHNKEFEYEDSCASKKSALAMAERLRQRFQLDVYFCDANGEGVKELIREGKI